MGRALIITSIFIILLILGCTYPSLGLKTRQDCENRITSSDQNQRFESDEKYKLVCIHEAAISAAYGYGGQNIEDSRELCRELRTLALPNAEAMRDTQANQCLYDIALIAARNGYHDESYARQYNMPITDVQGICREISSSNANAVLFGEEVTKESCSNQVRRLITNGPVEYQQNPSNLCSVVFVLLPFAGLAAYVRRA